MFLLFLIQLEIDYKQIFFHQVLGDVNIASNFR